MARIKATKRMLKIYSPLLLLFYNFVGNLSNDIYLPSLPLLTRHLHTTTYLANLTMTVWFIGVALPQLLFGIFADKYGKRPLIMYGGLVFMAATFLCAVSQNIGWLLLGRFFQGVGVCTLNVATFAFFRSRYYRENESAILLNYLNVIGAIAPILGPIAGGFIAHYLGWQATFTTVLILSVTPIAGLYLAMLEKSSNVNFSKQSSMSIMSFGRDYKKVIMNRRFIWPVLSYTLLMGALVSYLTVAPFLIRQVFSISTQYYGITQIPIFAAFILGTMITKRLFNRVPKKLLINTGLIISIINGGLLLFFAGLVDYLPLSLLILFMAGFLFGFGLAGGLLATEALSNVCQHHKGLASAVLGLCMACMCSLGSFIVAWLYHYTMLAPFIVISLFSMLASFCYVMRLGR